MLVKHLWMLVTQVFTHGTQKARGAVWVCLVPQGHHMLPKFDGANKQITPCSGPSI